MYMYVVRHLPSKQQFATHALLIDVDEADDLIWLPQNKFHCDNFTVVIMQ